MTNDPTIDLSAPLDPGNPRWTMMLPGDWWQIPLRDSTARTRAVKALVKDRFGGVDMDPALRRRTQLDLLSVAAQAATGGGELLALAIIDIGTIPITATLLVTQVPTLGMPIKGTDTFEDQLASTAPEGASVLKAQSDAGHVVRIVTTRQATTSPTDKAAMSSLPELKVTYWIILDTTEPALLNFVFTTPFVALQDGLLPLFDAIVESLHLPSPTLDEGPQECSPT